MSGPPAEVSPRDEVPAAASEPLQPDTPEHAAPARGVGDRLRHAGRASLGYAGVGSVLIGLWIALALTQEGFATRDNAINILEGNASLLVAAVGLTFVLLVGGFDLSLGGAAALAGVLLWKLIDEGVSPGLAVVAVVAAGFTFGMFVNGLLIAKVGLSFLVVTLATFGALGAGARLITEGLTMPIAQTGPIATLGALDRWHNLPFSVVIAFVVFVVALLVLRYTGYGRMIYAVGGNEEAARLAGINTTLVRMSAYGVCLGCASLAGVMYTSRLGAANPTAGADLALVAGAAVLLGGTTFFGGRGTVFGTLLGVLFLGVLSNGITFAGWDPNWEGFVTGVVLLLAILIDRLRSHRQRA